MTAGLGVVLLAVGGLLVGGVISFWSEHKVVAVVLAILAVLAVGGGVLRLVAVV